MTGFVVGSVDGFFVLGTTIIIVFGVGLGQLVGVSDGIVLICLSVGERVRSVVGAMVGADFEVGICGNSGNIGGNAGVLVRGDNVGSGEGIDGPITSIGCAEGSGLSSFGNEGGSSTEETGGDWFIVGVVGALVLPPNEVVGAEVA